MAASGFDAIVASVGISVGAAKRAIAAGQVTMNVAGSRRACDSGATLAYVAGPGRKMAASRPKPFLDWLLVPVETGFCRVNKPAGVPCQPTHAHPACLRRLMPPIPCAAAGPSPAKAVGHRLDTGTSGALVAARTPQAWEDLRKVFGGDNAGFGACRRWRRPPNKRPTWRGWRRPGPTRPPWPDEGRSEDTSVGGGPAHGRPGRRSDHVVLGKGRGLMSAETKVRWLSGPDAGAASGQEGPRPTWSRFRYNTAAGTGPRPPGLPGRARGRRSHLR